MARTCYFKEKRDIGGTRRYTNGGETTVPAGTMVKLNITDNECICGVTVADVAAGSTGMIYDSGVFALPCDSAQTFAIGDIVAWDTSAVVAIPYASRNDDDDFVAGTCNKETAGTMVEVELNYGPKEFYRNSFSSSPSNSPSSSVSHSASSSPSASVSRSPSSSASSSTS
jgi:predicted RecA/RadA family phage recombinase